MIKKIILVGVSILIPLFAGELFMRYRGEHNVRISPLRNRLAAQKLGVAFDERDPLTVVDALAKTGVRAFPALGPVEFWTAGTTLNIDGKEVIPLGGVSDVITVNCNESGTYSSYHSDEHGFANPEGLYGHGPIDMAIVGDSFAHGACVPLEKSIAGLLRPKFKKLLNLGMGGNGPLTELAGLVEYAAPLKPAAVLWMYYEGNDNYEISVERRSPVLMHYLEPGFTADLAGKQKAIDANLEKNLSAERASAAERDRRLGIFGANPVADTLFLRKIRLAIRLAREAAKESKWKDTYAEDHALLQKVLTRARDLTTSWGGKFYFVYLPSYSRYTDSPEVLADYHRDDILKMVKELGIPLIDVHESFSKVADVLTLFPFRLNNHYNEAGHALAAETILTTVPPAR